MSRGYRPIPADFETRWPEVGWSGAEAEWNAHPRSIIRWLVECDRERMAARRKAHLHAQRELRALKRRQRPSDACSTRHAGSIA